MCSYLDWTCSDIAKVLNYISFHGSLDYNEIEKSTGIKNVGKLVESLRWEYRLSFSPVVWHEKLQNSLGFYSQFRLKRYINARILYKLGSGIFMAVLKDPLEPFTAIVGGMNIANVLGEVLELLKEKNLVKARWVSREVFRKQYTIDYSKFNFEKKEFDANGIILDEPKTPIAEENLKRFTMVHFDHKDIKIVGKLQEGYSFEELPKQLNMPLSEIHNHYEHHVIGNGLLRSLLAFMGKHDFRISIFHSRNEGFERELARIATLLITSYLEPEKDVDKDKENITHWEAYSTLITSSSALSTVLDFIYTMANKYDVNYRVYIHPIIPTDGKYIAAGSIPYEYITDTDEWNKAKAIKDVKDNIEKFLKGELND
ncbi:MAG: hypothetical protein OWQ54_04440 [Sulfolobaceae archaeon]|nr:hypothetical protein [Sulfolobaceae archaeon]